jgi:uncharacterized protein (TIGR02147 family)
MDNSIFEHSDYRAYLRAKAGPRGTRYGVRLAMAQAIGCHSSYFTKILDADANLNLEQSLKLSTYFQMTAEESDYFLLLVQKARSGTKALERYFETKLDALQQKRLSLKERVSIKRSLSREDQATYYGSWHFAAIHMALTVLQLNTRGALASYFELTEKKVGEILEFLISVGLAVEEKGTFKVGPSELHLEGDSPSILKHHTNWRTKAITALDREDALDLHYSGVFTLSKADAASLRERLVKVIRDSVSFATQSKNEDEVLCFALDFFGLGDRR